MSHRKPYISGFHAQMLFGFATSWQPFPQFRIGKCRCAAIRGIPRMMWMPNFSPSEWI